MSEEKPRDPDASTPDLEEVDSAWDDDELDEDATTVAQIPKDLLSRLRSPEAAPEKAAAGAAVAAEPEKHEAITARPPPMGPGAAGAEPSVVVDAPHQQLADAAPKEAAAEQEDEDADASDAAEGDEEARARAADEAAGLDAEARRKAAEQRNAVRRDKARAKTLAARERRKAKADVQRQKQKQKKKRSLPPRANSERPPSSGEAPPASRERPTVPPARESSAVVAGASSPPRQDWLRMTLVVALVVIFGALVIGLARR